MYKNIILKGLPPGSPFLFKPLKYPCYYLNKFIFAGIFLLCSFNLQAQTLEWDIGFFGFADNREY